MAVCAITFRISFLRVPDLYKCGCTCRRFHAAAEQGAKEVCDKLGWPKFECFTHLGTLHVEKRKKGFKIHCHTQRNKTHGQLKNDQEEKRSKKDEKKDCNRI